MTKPREKTHEEVGLDGVKLIVGDKCLGMLEAVGEVFPEAKYQRCTVHFYGGFAATRGCTPCAAYATIYLRKGSAESNVSWGTACGGS